MALMKDKDVRMTRIVYICCKLGHIIWLCFKTLTIRKESIYYAKLEDVYAFATSKATHLESLHKWIGDIRATKHITLWRIVFDIYKDIVPWKVFLGSDRIVEAIRIGSIIVEIMVEGQMKRITIKDLLSYCCEN